MEYIRADANMSIASGHIMRCMAVAQEIKKLNRDVTFIIADDYPVQMLEERGFKYIILDVDWNDKVSEIDKLIALIKENNIERLLIDSYQVTPEYFKRISEYTRVTYIDDLNAFKYDVDKIINYCHFYKEFGYDKIYTDGDAKLYLGCDYIPLREEFCCIEDKIIEENIRNILITTGGADLFKTAKFIAAKVAPKYEDIRFHIVMGSFFVDTDEYEKLAEQNKNICLHYNVSKMSELMKVCDAAISAGGTTLYELCACGTPTICFYVADNQKKGVNAMVNDGIMLGGCDVREGMENFGVSMEADMERTMDKNIRQMLSRKMKSLVDGRGARRIADVFCGGYKEI